MTQPLSPQSELYPLLLPEASLALEGKLIDGGRGAVQLGPSQPIVQFELASPELIILALLMRQMMFAFAAGLRHSAAFLGRDELSALLRKLGLSDPQQIVKTVWKLREALRAAFADVRDPLGRDFSELIIETQKIGYRISLDPANLHLSILDEHRLTPILPLRGAPHSVPPTQVERRC